jgi:hypothetical protein
MGGAVATVLMTLAGGLGFIGLLGLNAVPAQAHITGPQLISHFDSFSPPAPGVSFSLLSTGSAPYASVSVSGNHTFVIDGYQGTPFIRITDQGVELNRNSPSVEYMVNSPSKPLPAFGPPNLTPSWYQVSTQTTYHYYERRAEWPHTGQPVEAQLLGKTATVFRTAIPASYDGITTAINIHVTWVPAPFNLEVPLLFVPIVVVLLLWVEPRAKSYVHQIATGTALAVAVGAALDAARTILALNAPAGGDTGAGTLARLAPASVLPGLVLLVALALPRVRAGRRSAYGWVALFGLYLLTFGLLRTDLVTSSASGLVTWLHRGEVVTGLLVTCGAGLLLFLTSPTRQPDRPRRGTGKGRGPVAYGQR